MPWQLGQAIPLHLTADCGADDGPFTAVATCGHLQSRRRSMGKNGCWRKERLSRLTLRIRTQLHAPACTRHNAVAMHSLVDRHEPYPNIPRKEIHSTHTQTKKEAACQCRREMKRTMVSNGGGRGVVFYLACAKNRRDGAVGRVS